MKIKDVLDTIEYELMRAEDNDDIGKDGMISILEAFVITAQKHSYPLKPKDVFFLMQCDNLSEKELLESHEVCYMDFDAIDEFVQALKLSAKYRLEVY